MDTNSKGFMAKFQAVLEKYVVPVATKISQQRHLAGIHTYRFDYLEEVLSLYLPSLQLISDLPAPVTNSS